MVMNPDVGERAVEPRGRDEEIRNNRAALDAYFSDLARRIGPVPEDLPSVLWCINSDVFTDFATHVRRGTALTSRPGHRSPVWPSMIRLVLRETAKFTVLKGLALVKRLGRRGIARPSALAKAEVEAIYIGFVDTRRGPLDTKDFYGARDTVFAELHARILGHRLPSVSWSAYMGNRDGIIPVEAYYRWSQLVRFLWRSGAFLHRLRKAGLDGTPAMEAHLAELVGGSPCASVLYADAVRRILSHRPGGRPLTAILPFERHDWELLVMANLKALGIRPVAVQNGVSSLNDYCMYMASPGSPAYRFGLPEHLYCIGKIWMDFYRAIGIDCPITLLERHRFSGQDFPLTLRPGSRTILYLGGIGRDKFDHDLRILDRLRPDWDVLVRPHPTMPPSPWSKKFESAPPLDETDFHAAVYTNSSMAFQIVCDRRRLLYLSDTGHIDQDPLAVAPDLQGQKVWAGEDLEATVQAVRQSLTAMDNVS